MIHINRQDKKKYEKAMRSKGYSPRTAKMMADLREEIEKSAGNLQVGDKVKLNLKSIQSHPNYERLTDTYKTFVNENVDKVFTVESHRSRDGMVAFVEDTTEPKWLFWAGDLEKVKE